MEKRSVIWRSTIILRIRKERRLTGSSNDFLDTLAWAYRDALETGNLRIAQIILHVCAEKGIISAEEANKTLDIDAQSGRIKIHPTTAADASGRQRSGKWITINGAHVLIDGSGTITAGPKKFVGKSIGEVKGESKASSKPEAKQQEYEGTAEHPSATGTNVPCTGFASEYKLYDHAGRHGPEFGTKDHSQYQREGIEFLTSAVGGDVRGYMTPEGKIVRFNPATGQYASGFPGKHLCTYQVPKIRQRDLYYDPQKAIRYYESRKAEDLGKTGGAKWKSKGKAK